MNISDIKANPNNPRIIKDDKFKKLVESVKNFPEMLELRPIVVNKDMIILGGNMRFKACKEAGIKEIPVIIADNLTEEQEREFLIKDNVSGGEWDWDILANEWDKEELEEWGLDVTFDTVEPEAEEDEFEIDEGVKTDIVLGDLFEIGTHRLLCGDSTNIDDVNKLMNGEKADMVFTDPPYLMDFTGAVNEKGQKSNTGKKHDGILNDKMTKEDGEKFLYDVCSIIRLFNQGAFYISFYRLGIDWMMNAITRSGMKWRNLIIWKKNNHNLSNSDYKSLYEPIIVGYADDYVPILYGWSIEHNYYGKKNEKDIWEITESSVWEIDKTKINDLHPTMKPIKLMERAIKNSSKQLGSVLDLFGGSGSTMVACHQLNRKCYMSELDPKYVQTIVNRMQKLDPSLEIKRNGKPYIIGK